METLIESDFIRMVLKRHSVIAEQRIPRYLFKISTNFGQAIL